jgi:protein TonB
VHCTVLFLWLHREPIFVKPSDVAWGHQGTSTTLTYYAPPAKTAERAHPKILLKQKQKASPEPPQQPVETARAGMPTGSLFSGPSSGVDARPALPLVFPDPSIYPWQLKGVQGDVVVEVTIDQQGNVTNTKVLQSLKEEIDEKCIATLLNWRFRPATIDGVAISSRQDVHFHFPS